MDSEMILFVFVSLSYRLRIKAKETPNPLLRVVLNLISFVIGVFDKERFFYCTFNRRHLLFGVGYGEYGDRFDTYLWVDAIPLLSRITYPLPDSKPFTFTIKRRDDGSEHFYYFPVWTLPFLKQSLLAASTLILMNHDYDELAKKIADALDKNRLSWDLRINKVEPEVPKQLLFV